MILHKLHANFGKLKEQTLTLQPGLNLLQMPNEAGKTTWSDFLLAMFYGIDTAERRSKSVLPFKEKYRPWDGGTMHGSMELTHEGRRLTLERSGSERAPMAELRCRETDSGLPISAITAQTCGQTLLGVERSVYERSGFLHQQQLAVSQDPALEQRLSALVTTGDDGCSYLELDEQLKKLKNHYRYNRSGQIPQTEAQLEDCQRALAQVYAVQAQLAEAAARRQQCEQELAELLRQRNALQTQAALARRARLDEAEAQLRQAEQAVQQAQAQCATLPTAEVLQTLAQDLDATQRELQALELRLAQQSDPVRIQALEGNDAAQQLKVDADRLALLPPDRSTGLVLPLIAVLLLMIGLGAFFLPLITSLPVLTAILIGAVLLLTGAALLTAALQRRRQQHARTAVLAELRGLYGTEDPAALTAQIQALQASLRREREQTGGAQSDRSQLQLRRSALITRSRQLLDAVDAFGVKTDSLAAAAADVQAALRRREQLVQARQRLTQAREHCATLHSVVKQEPAPAADCTPEEANRIAQTVDPDRLAAQLTQCETQLRALRSGIDTANGQLKVLGDALELEAERSRLAARLAALQQAYEAAELARQTLAEANAALQARFAPLLCSRASELFSRLTEGRYEKVLLDGTLSVRVQACGESVTRELRQLSAGTVDQLYLALRLAISELLLPDAPLVLDDALLSFDDRRAAIALQLLQELAQHRQILLFTCQSREARLLADPEGGRRVL